jgi:hypothetical protein
MLIFVLNLVRPKPPPPFESATVSEIVVYPDLLAVVTLPGIINMEGSYIGLKVGDRICQLCKDGIEDEVHFLLQCPSLQKERWEIINNINEIKKV